MASSSDTGFLPASGNPQLLCNAAPKPVFVLLPPGYNRAVGNKPLITVGAAQRLVQIAFGASFFLPGLYYGSLLLLSSKGSRVAVTAFLLASIITPVVIIAVSKQSVLAKLRQILFAAIAWAVIQFFTFMVLGVAALMRDGLSGVP